MQSGSAQSVWRELARQRQGPLQSVCHGRSRHEAQEGPLPGSAASIIAGDEMPDDVGLEPPAWWKRGDGLSPPVAPPAEATEALDHVDADPEPGHVEVSPKKKRKKVMLDPRLKNWFLCFVELQRARHGWDMQRPVAEAKRLCPASRRSTRTHRGAGRNYHRCPVFTAQVGQPSCQRHRSHC